MDANWPAALLRGSGAALCWGAAAVELPFAALDAAVELHTSAAGTAPLCWAAGVEPAGSPTIQMRQRKSKKPDLNKILIASHREQWDYMEWKWF